MDVKSIAIIVGLIIFIGVIFGLAYRNIKQDAEKLSEKYEIKPEAGDDIFGRIGEEIAFKGKNLAQGADYPEVDYAWDFDGDGEVDWKSETLVTAYHTYEEPGDYIATFRIFVTSGKLDYDGSDSLKVTIYDNTPPVASVTVSSERVNVSETLKFSAVNSYDAEDSLVDLEFSWDVDNDGIEDGGEKELFYSYAEPGEYLATVTVTDSGGLDDTASQTVYVNEPEEVTEEVELEDGGNGTIFPNTPVSNSSQIFNWDMTEDMFDGLVKIEVVLTWEDMTWDLDVFFGKGADRTAGEVYGEDTGGEEGSGEGTVTLETTDSTELQYDSEEQWFAEVITKEGTRTANGNKLISDNCEFEVSVILTYVSGV